jgi:hypothetical protein
MAAISFPDLEPSARSYLPGSYPIEQFEGQNGAVTAVRFGNRKKDSQLTLTFQNITDAEAFEIWENHQEVNGGLDSEGDWNYIKFEKADAGAMAGIKSDSMRAVTGEFKVNRRYRYAEPPQFVSTFPGRCTVTVVLRGYLDGPLN